MRAESGASWRRAHELLLFFFFFAVECAAGADFICPDGVLEPAVFCAGAAGADDVPPCRGIAAALNMRNVEGAIRKTKRIRKAAQRPGADFEAIGEEIAGLLREK